MKKHLFLTALVLALVMCFSLGVCAHEQGNVVTTGADDPNQYVITDALKAYEGTTALWIGTLADWKAAGFAVGDTGTALVNGEALNDDDIIITNGKVLISLAVGTRNPWGYPAGSILDAGRVDVVDGKFVGGRDTVWSVETLVNGWDSWAPNNCGVVTFDLVQYDFDNKVEVTEGGLAAVKVSRVYTIAGLDMDVVSYYSIAPGAEYAYMFDQMTNNADVATPSLSNRFAMTNKGDDGGSMFGGTIKAATAAYAGMVATYGDNDKNTYFTALIMPGNVERFDSATGEKLDGVVEPSRIGGSVGYKCVRVDSKGNFSDGVNKYDKFQPGEQRTYNNYVYIDDAPTPAGAIALIAAIEGDELMNVAGTAAPNATIVVEKGGLDFGWYQADAEGKFAFQLPASDDFVIFTEEKGKDFGTAVPLPAEGAEDLVLESGAAKVEITLNLKDAEGNAVYGKVEVPNLYPTVRYNGNSIFQAEEKGKVVAEVAADTEKVVVYGQGYWFYSNPVEVAIEEGKTEYDVTIDLKYGLAEGWLSGDMHHHGDKNDAFAAVTDLVPSIAASDIDVMFVTDHDFTTNNYAAYKLANDYEIEGFLPSEEVSASWAHFNVVPYDEEGYNFWLDEEGKNVAANQFADLQVFVDEVHSHNAGITANHPWYSYGLFYADYCEAIPGGYTDDFDNIEINACNAESETYDTINTTVALWNTFINGGNVNVSGEAVETSKPHYLVGGSDTHDVLYPGFSGANYENVRGNAWYATGKIRTVAYTGELEDNLMDNGLKFANAVLAGNSYVTFGPLLQMDAENVPGALYNGDKFEVTIKVESLATIKDVVVLTEDADDLYIGGGYTDGMYVDNELSTFDVNANEYTIEFSADVEEAETTWYAFYVVDVNGNFAITNPYWVTNTFSDVTLGDWYYDAVTALQADGIINGFEDGSFQPDGNVTRAQFAKMIYEAMGGASANAGAEPVAFSDVTENDWFYEAVTALAAEGIITGYPDGTFNPNGNITRAEMAVMIYRAIGFDQMFDNLFTDVEPSSWYYNAVTILGGLGVVNGMGDGTFAPTATATRAQAAQIIYNVEYMPQ